MSEHTFFKVVAGALLGSMALALFAALLFDMALDSTVRDCEKIGRFRHGDRVFECSMAVELKKEP